MQIEKENIIYLKASMESLREDLNSKGVCFLPKIFSDKKVSEAREGLWDVIQGKYETGIEPEARFWNVGDNPKNIIKIDKPHLSNQKIWNLITDTGLGKWLADITRSTMIQVWHSQSVWKPAGGGQRGNAGWHRDIQYWPFWKPGGVFTAWIALSDVNERSGPVRYISGSQKWSTIEGLDFFDKDIVEQDAVLQNSYNNLEVLHGHICKGQVGIHTSSTYHSSGPNSSRDPRVGMVIHFCTDRAERVPVKGENQNYLNQRQDQAVCPIIYN